LGCRLSKYYLSMYTTELPFQFRISVSRRISTKWVLFKTRLSFYPRVFQIPMQLPFFKALVFEIPFCRLVFEIPNKCLKVLCFANNYPTQSGSNCQLFVSGDTKTGCSGCSGCSGCTASTPTKTGCSASSTY
jgi:hypothetical protein